jgi:predicted metal-dependent peptidase
VLDTSGSISADELSVYTAAVLGILEETSPEAVALIQCDAEVQRVDTIQPGESFNRIEVHGRGGTRFQPAFDWIAESAFGADAIVYATDLHCSDQPQDPGLPVISLTPTHPDDAVRRDRASQRLRFNRFPFALHRESRRH